jgi:hypothetical protein
MINLMSWRARNVIEIAHDHWWGAGMMTLARSAGVQNYAIVRDGGDATETVGKVEGWIRAFRGETKRSP